jgi:hypothetical protein
VPGSAFYALTKEEKKVQPNKQILVMVKGQKSVYGGAEARRLLGLPSNKTVRVVPGNHANFDIYIWNFKSPVNDARTWDFHDLMIEDVWKAGPNARRWPDALTRLKKFGF